MARETRMGMNKTGAQMAPEKSRELLQGSQRSSPTSEGDETDLLEIRGDYIREADPIGSVPPPTTIRGALKNGAQLLTGNRPQVLLDKLGERLAFERGGTRLYDALILKIQAGRERQSVLSVDQLMHIRDEEMKHFELVANAIDRLGGDPTSMTPCADLVGVETLGLMQSVNDPRTSIAQCLNAVLTAELADNAGWDLLITLARETGNDALMPELETALLHEQEHLQQVKAWLQALTLADAKVLAKA